MSGSNISISDDSLLSVDRAADDLRRGQLVVITDKTQLILVGAAEFASIAMLERFHGLGLSPTLLLTRNRADTLKVASKGWPVVRVIIDQWMQPVEIQAVADPTLDLKMPFKGPYARIDIEPGLPDQGASQLAKLARLLPTMIVADITDAASLPDTILHVEASTILGADAQRSKRLTKVADARVPLIDAEDCRLVSFRPVTGGAEHMAIIVGEPSPSSDVLARLHSECFTGDLLASLKCDCGDQLRGAIKACREAGGGIVLYLAQEGRGIGLISKLKAYRLQADGFDTVDANTRLGFEVDERLFVPAAEMLRHLGFNKIRLMTNNPEKVTAMQRFGIEVTEQVSHAFKANPHNEQYLNTKRDRTGHTL